MESELVINALKIISEDKDFFSTVDSKIKNLFEQAKEDSSVSRFNIRDKSLLISTYRTKWFMILTKEKSVLRKLKDEFENYISDQILEMSRSGTSLPKVALRAKLESSEKAIELQSMISKQEDLIQFLNGIRAIFDDFSYTINNSLNALQQEMT